MYDMFLITEKKAKIKIPCSKCLERGFILKGCTMCGGNGLRNKTIEYWDLKGKITVEKIDRASFDCTTYKGEKRISKGDLRYWEDKSCFFCEADKLVHFNKQDAVVECRRRNVNTYGVDFCRQYLG